MSSNSKDLALEALLAVRAEIAPDLDEQLLRSCYAIQLKHQFDQDRSAATVAIDRLIEAEVEKRASGGGAQP